MSTEQHDGAGSESGSGPVATTSRPSRPFGWAAEEEPLGELADVRVSTDIDPARTGAYRFSRAVGTNTGTAVVVREGYVPFGGGTLGLPEHYFVTIDDPRWPVCHLEVMVEDGAPRCAALQCERRQGDPAINQEVLAGIPLAHFLKRSASAAAVRCG